MGLIDRLSLRDTISLAVAATIAAVALPAVAIHTYVSRRPIGHHTTQQLAPIAHLLAVQAAPLISPDQRQRLDQWTAAAAHADVVLALAVFDADGRLASLHADRAELVNLLATAGAAPVLKVYVGQCGNIQILQGVTQTQGAEPVVAGVVLVGDVQDVGAGEIVRGQRLVACLQGQ